MHRHVHFVGSRPRTSALCVVTVAAGLMAVATPASAATGCTTTRYVSPTGADSAGGASPRTAWRTVNRVNAAILSPGTCVLFRGGATFDGGLYLPAADAGSDAHRVVIGSYGAGRATISSGTGIGIFVYDTAGVTVRDLVITGNGYDANSSSGIFFYNDLPGATRLTGITVSSVDVSGYGESGIAIGGYPADGSKSGFSRVLVSSSATHDNADAGLQSFGAYSATAAGYAHHDVTVRDVRSYRNVGRLDKGNNSGNGIVLGDVDNAAIEHSQAYDNGARNNFPGGGPVGIWTYDSNRVTIQHNESYANKSATVDGDGFDLDGGVTNSVLQYNFSHDNQGAGYLVFQYAGARPMHDNVVRYNISVNDNRVGKYGSLTIGSFGSPVRDTLLYGNTVVTGPNQAGAAAGVRVWDGTENARFLNNIVAVSGCIPLVSVERNTSATFQGNDYWSSGGAFVALVGGTNFDDSAATRYSSLAAWRAATGVETLSGRTVDPQFAGDPATTDDAAALLLRRSSPLIGAGLDLHRLGIDAGGHDYFGVRVPTREGYSVGAAQL
jgi:hypothetical protein